MLTTLPGNHYSIDMMENNKRPADAGLQQDRSNKKSAIAPFTPNELAAQLYAPALVGQFIGSVCYQFASNKPKQLVCILSGPVKDGQNNTAAIAVSNYTS